jgi:RHS repeat-associated protein
MLEPGRKFAQGNSKYRYGFNGKEKDNEVKGEGNQQDYGMRIYDPRIGKFLSVDPIVKEYPELTPYQFASNTPIQAIDLDGLEALLPNGNPWHDFFVWLFNDDVEEVSSGIDDLYEHAQSQVTTQKDIRVYNEISKESNPEFSIDDYNAVKQAQGAIKGFAGIIKVTDGVNSIGSKFETIATIGLSSTGLISNAEKNAARAILKAPTKLTTSVSVERKPITLNTPQSKVTTSNSPNFIVDKSGQTFPVPKGAKGPTLVVNPNGKQTGVAFTGGNGGENGKVATIRIMDPTPPRGKSPGYPNGYIKYENAASPKPQGVNPQSGQTIPNTQSHYPIKNKKG